MLFRTLKGLSKKGITIIGSVKSRGKGLFSKYLLITNTVITVSSSCAGDILQQRYEILCNRQTSWDLTRNRRITFTGLVIGPVCHFWYLGLDKIFPGRTVSMIIKKVLLDQIVFSPVNISVFLLTMGYLQSKSKQQVLDDLRLKGFDLFKAEWLIWPPAQLVNFALVPLQYRVLFDNVISFGFDYYYSYVMFRKEREEKSEDETISLDFLQSQTHSYCCKIPEHSSVRKL